MKFRNFASLIFLTLLAVLFVQVIAAPSVEGVVALAVCAFIGFNALGSTWQDHSPGRFAQNVIADDLQITRVLENAIIGLKQALMPLTMFSTAMRNVPVGNVEGDNSITVPVYSFSQTDDVVKDRSPGDDYTALITGTTTAARKIAINK